MSALPPPDPEENRRLIAERLRWPTGALEACAAIEQEFPAWMVWWNDGALPVAPLPGYRASLLLHGHRAELYASTADELRAQVATVDAELPRSEFPARFTPLVEPPTAG